MILSPENKSPLAEANPESLNELFSRDPLDLSQQDITLIVTEFRRMRIKWDLGEKTAKKPKVKDDTIKLTDLDL